MLADTVQVVEFESGRKTEVAWHEGMTVGEAIAKAGVMLPITLEQAKALRPGMVLHHVNLINRDGSPARFRVNGQVKTWKRSPGRVCVPLKHGMYTYDYLTEANLDQFCLPGGES